MRQIPGGAAPAADLLQKAGKLTRHQRAILDVLVESPDGMDVATLSRETGSHPNTVRGHLSALTSRGLVSYQKREDGTKGRPALVYRAASAAPESPAQHLVDLLHAALGSLPEETRGATAYEWGQAWAGYIEAGKGDDLRGTVVTLMTEMGFAPRVSADRLDLYRCPLMSSKADIMRGICQIHQGMLDALAEADGSTLVQVIPSATRTTCQVVFGEAG